MRMRLPRMWRRVGVRIFLTFSSLLIGMALVFSAVGLKFAEEKIRSNAESELKVQSIVLSRLVQTQLTRIEQSLSSMENHGFLVEELRKQAPDKAAIEDFLQQRLRLLPLFDDLAVFNRAGACIGATDPAWYEVDGKDKPFFIINNPSDFSFSYIFTQEEGRVQLASTRITNGTVTKGVLVGQVNMSSIYDLMDQKLGVSESSDAFLVDSALRFVTPGKSGTDKLLESHLIATPLQKHLNQEFWVGQYRNFTGQEVLGTAVHVPGPGRHWYVVVERDLAEVTRPINDAKKLVLAATVALVAALTLLTFLVTRSITRPLKTLVDGAQRVGRGDFRQPIAIPRGIDEVAFVAAEMEKMRGKVFDFQESLMERLEESEKKRLENERLAAIGTLASTLAHEIRNPLNAMSLLLSRLEHARDNSTERRTTVVRDLRNEIGRLDRLVNDILDYARPLHLQYKDIDLQGLVDSTLELYRALFEGKRIGLKVQFPDGPIRLRVDPDRVKQCLVNVLQNAVEATPAGGNVDIEARRDGGLVHVVVRDDGIGLPPEPEGRLFDLFFTTKETGTGLGLSTVKKIVDAHGGKISLGSRADVRGAEVRLTFPQNSLL